jgi:hypothetical protein
LGGTIVIPQTWLFGVLFFSAWKWRTVRINESTSPTCMPINPIGAPINHTLPHELAGPHGPNPPVTSIIKREPTKTTTLPVNTGLKYVWIFFTALAA